MFREMQCDRTGDVEIGSFGPALFQDEGGDLLTFGLQRSAVFLVTQIGVFLVAVDCIALEGLAF